MIDTFPDRFALNVPVLRQLLLVHYRDPSDPVLSACDLIYGAEALKECAERMEQAASRILKNALITIRTKVRDI